MAEGSEMQFVDSSGITDPPMHLLLEPRVVGCDELAGAATALRIRTAGNAAVRAQAAKGC